MFKIYSHHLLKPICVFHLYFLHNVCVISEFSSFLAQFLIFPRPLLSYYFSSSVSISTSTAKALRVLLLTTIFVRKWISKRQPKKKNDSLKMLQVSPQRHPTCWCNIAEMLVYHFGFICRDLCMQFNLLVTLCDSLIIVLAASTLARNFIMLKTMIKNRNKCWTLSWIFILW